MGVALLLGGIRSSRRVEIRVTLSAKGPAAIDVSTPEQETKRILRTHAKQEIKSRPSPPPKGENQSDRS